jgi:ATP-dependent Clp protease ATP-binding subunit ClpA
MEFGRAVERATGFINQRQFLFALHIGSARQQVQPLPFAGEPKLSAQARMAIEQAWAYARERPTQLSTVVLLMGLLSVKAVAREVIESNVGNVDKVIDRLWSGLPEMPVVEGRHFESVKSLAHALAKNEGSPLVLDYHLLDALLEIQSDALDKALRLIATTRRDLRAYLYKSIRSDRAQKSITSIFSQFPSE